MSARDVVRHAADLLAEHGHEYEAEQLDAVIRATDTALSYGPDGPPAALCAHPDCVRAATVDRDGLWCREHAPDPVTATFAAIETLAGKLIPDAAVMLTPDVDGLAQLLQALRRAIAQLRFCEEQLEDELVKAMPGKDVEVPGVGVITLRTGTTRKGWDKEALTAAVTARIADDPLVFCEPETGEFLPPHEVAERVIAEFMACATPSWKVTGLRKLTIDPDEYAEVTYGRKQIQTPTIDVTALFSKDSD